MLDLNYNIIRTVTKINPIIIEEVDKLEDYVDDHEKIEGILRKFDSNPVKNIENFKNMDFNTKMVFLTSMTTTHLVMFLTLITKNDYSVIVELIDQINDQRDVYTDEFKNKMFLLYRISEYPEIFSNENFMLIYNTLKEI